MKSEMELIDLINKWYVVDPIIGTILHKRKWGRSQPGKRAGYISSNGYRILSVDYQDYFEHNLMWLMVHGKFPPEGREVDHINRKKDDNRIINLRLATRGQNNVNAKLRSNNRTGCRGVYFDSQRGMYNVQVTFKKKTYSLGRYLNLQEANKVAVVAREKFYGEFARISS